MQLISVPQYPSDHQDLLAFFQDIKDKNKLVHAESAVKVSEQLNFNRLVAKLEQVATTESVANQISLQTQMRNSKVIKVDVSIENILED